MASNLLKRFPETTEEAMKEKFPLVKWNELTRFVEFCPKKENKM